MTIIQLAQGNIGWYDGLTSIHLTLTKNQAIVKDGMNTTNIKKGLAEGKIILVQGTLETTREIEQPTKIFLKEEVIEPVTIKEEAPKKEAVKTPKAKVTRTKANKKTKK